MIEDGICLINIEGNGAKKSLPKLLRKNKEEITLIFLDQDTSVNNFQSSGFSSNDSYIFIGEKEFEDAFCDKAICLCLNQVWPRNDNTAWESSHIVEIRSDKEKKFSDRLMNKIRENSLSEVPNKKSVYGNKIATYCPKEAIPEKIVRLFEKARKISKAI